MVTYILAILTRRIWHSLLSEQASLYISEKLKPYGNTWEKKALLWKHPWSFQNVYELNIVLFI